MLICVGKKKFLKINKRDVLNKGVMDGKSFEKLINVQHRLLGTLEYVSSKL